jgi:DNA-binding response OmpR family regulator
VAAWPAGPAALAGAQVTAQRILVVEDDPSVRGLLQTLLTAEGYDVSTASDGLAGLAKASAQAPALILLDVMMPDLGGVRVLEELRGDPALADVPVIVVTGKVEAAESLRALLGPEMVFVKPFVVAELLARVAAVTGGEAAPPDESAGPHPG